MNNMQKAFKRKGLADGGRVSPHMLGTGGAAMAGIALARRPGQIAAALDNAEGGVPAAASVVAPAGAGGMSGIRNGAMPPQGLLLAQRRGMADGGVPKRKPHGGLVRGPGGPTDDEAGLFDLSNEEYVLPADTVDAMGGPEVLDGVRDATHDFVNEENRPRGLADGGMIDSLRKKAASVYGAGKRAVTGLGAARTVPAPELATGGFTNAERAATPAGYKTGGFAQPAPPPNRALSFAKSVGTKVLAPLAAASAIGDSMAEDSTDRYAKRFGVSAPTGDGSAGDILKFAGLRAGGFASDLGNTLTGGLAGKLYADKPSEDIGFVPNAAAAVVPPTAPPVPPPAQGLRQASALPPNTGGEITGASTRADGKLNSFSGGSDRVNPEDFEAATQRAAADKSRLVGLAAAKMSEGDLDGAYRLAAGDPEATAAVESARQQRGLRIRAGNGDKEASELLQQQSVNEAGLAGKRIDAEATTGAAALKAQADLRLGLAKAQSDAAKDERAQRNADRSFGLQERALGNAEGQQNQKNIQGALEGVLGPRALKDGVPNPAYADFEAKLNETLLQGAAGADGKPRTMQNLSAAELQDFLRAYQLNKEAQPGALGKAVNFLTGNSRPESNDLLLNAPRTGTAKEGLLYDTYQDGQGQVLRVGGLAGRDLTVEERRRVGLPTGLR